MANLSLFNKSGHYTAPDAATLAALSEPERVAIARICDASHILDAANLAAETNATALKQAQSEIAELEKSIPKITFNDLAKAAAAETMRRRAGL
jgi:hypothetical protein